MELKNDKHKLNFIIGTFFGFGEVLTGGNVAMHLLAYKLAERGHNVYIFTKPEYHHENIHSIQSKSGHNDKGVMIHEWEGFSFPLDKTIAIYDEITHGNIFNVLNVNRWILYNVDEHIENTWSESDTILNFGNFTNKKNIADLPLTVFDYKFDYLYDEMRERNGYCHILHKNTPHNADSILDSYNSTDIGDWKSRGAYNYLREEFNKYKYFLTFDRHSFYTIAAGLCGCIPIILNPEDIPPQLYRSTNPQQSVGIAYGIDDVQWAVSTLPYIRDHIKSLETLNNKTVDDFVSYWEDKTGVKKV